MEFKSDLFTLLKEVAEFASPEDEARAKRKWLGDLSSGGEKWTPEDVETSIQDKISGGGLEGVPTPYKIYSPHGSNHLFWQSQSGGTHYMPKDQAGRLSGQYQELLKQGGTDADFATYDMMHPEGTSEGDLDLTSDYRALGMSQDPEHGDKNYLQSEEEGGMPTLAADRVRPEDQPRIDIIRKNAENKFIDEIISKDGTLWDLPGVRLIDNPQAEFTKVRGFIEPRPLEKWDSENPREDWANKISLKRMVNDYTNYMFRMGELTIDEIEENMNNNIIKSFSLLDKFINHKDQLVSQDYDELTSMVQTDGKTIFITLSNGNRMTMHNNTLSKEIIKRFSEDPALEYPDIVPEYTKSNRILTPNKILTATVEDAKREKYYDLVGTLGEFLVGATGLVSRNPEKARELMAQAAYYAKGKVQDIQQAIDVITNYGEVDLELACKSLQEYALFDLMNQMDNDPNGWSFSGQKVDTTDVRQLLAGIVFHLRKPLELSSKDDLNYTDYLRTGDMEKGDFKNQDGIFLYASEDLAKLDAEEKFGIVNFSGNQIPVNQKQIATFKDVEGADKHRGIKSQVNGGKVNFLNFIRAGAEDYLQTMLDFTQDSFSRSQGREMSSNVVRHMKDIFTDVQDLHTKIEPVLNSENIFEEVKETLIDRVHSSTLNSTERRGRIKELEGLKFDRTGKGKGGVPIWTDRVKLANYTLIGKILSLAKPSVSGRTTASQKRFVGITSLLMTNAEIKEDLSDIGFMVSDNFQGKLYRSAQSKIIDPLVAGIIKNPNLVYVAREEGRTISIIDPDNHARVALSLTFSKSPGMPLQSKWSNAFLLSKAHSVLSL